MLVIERQINDEWQVIHSHPYSKNLNKEIKTQFDDLSAAHGRENVRCRHMPDGRIKNVPLEKHPYHVQQKNGRWVFKMLTRDEASKLIAKSMGLK
jgi:hypothetical protein